MVAEAACQLRGRHTSMASSAPTRPHSALADLSTDSRVVFRVMYGFSFSSNFSNIKKIPRTLEFLVTTNAYVLVSDVLHEYITSGHETSMRVCIRIARDVTWCDRSNREFVLVPIRISTKLLLKHPMTAIGPIADRSAGTLHIIHYILHHSVSVVMTDSSDTLTSCLSLSEHDNSTSISVSTKPMGFYTGEVEGSSISVSHGPKISWKRGNNMHDVYSNVLNVRGRL